MAITHVYQTKRKEDKMSKQGNEECSLHKGFSLKERIIMQIGWNGFMLIGIYAIYKQSPLWALAYVAYIIIGFAFIVMPMLCAYCPYPYQYSTCLFMPAGILRKFYPYRGAQTSLAGRTASGIIMVGAVLIPNYWLFRDIPLFFLFWLFALPTLLALPLHYCKQCRHSGCPANRVKA